jgi:hypothetical protein
MNKPIKKVVLYDEKGEPSVVLLDYETYKEIEEIIDDVIDLETVKNLEPDELIPWEKAKEFAN